MKKVTIVLMLLAILVVSAGCSGVTMNAEYSELLDKTCALSAEINKRAQAGELDEAHMKLALDKHNETWHLFKKARDGEK